MLFWTVFCSFTSLTTRKIKILKKWKNRLEILSFYTCAPKMTTIWCMVPEILSAANRNFFILYHFLTFYPLNNLKNQNFDKMKKTPGDIIILHTCTINDNHMMYGSWDMKCEEHNFLSFWTIFCPFTSLTTLQIKILKKCKKHLEMLSFYTCVS